MDPYVFFNIHKWNSIIRSCSKKFSTYRLEPYLRASSLCLKNSKNQKTIVQLLEKPYESTWACLWSTNVIRSVDVPEANIIVAITRAEDLGFIGVKIKGHYRCSMTRNGSSEVTRLHRKLVVVVSRNRRQKKWLQLKEMNYYTSEASQILIVLSNDDVASWVVLGLKRTSVMIWPCSSGVLSVCSVSMFQIKTYWQKHIICFKQTRSDIFINKMYVPFYHAQR